MRIVALMRWFIFFSFDVFRAILMRPDDWVSYSQSEDEKLQQSIFILMRLHEIITSTDDFEAMEIDAELENAAPDLIAESVVQLHEYRKRTARSGGFGQ